MGVGNFFGLRRKTWQTANSTAVELDSSPGASQLYPEADISGGFETTSRPGFYATSRRNVPFGQRTRYHPLV